MVKKKLILVEQYKTYSINVGEVVMFRDKLM